MLMYMLSLKLGSGPSSCMYSSDSSSLNAISSPLEDPSLQSPHALEPSVVVAGLALEEGEYFGMGQDQELLLADGLHDHLGHVLGLHDGARRSHHVGTGVRAGLAGV